MAFNSAYTTKEKADKDPIGEKDKVVITNDAYALTEVLQDLVGELRRIK